MKIGTKSIVKAWDILKLLYAHRSLDMVEAAAVSDDGLTVSMTAKFTPSKKAVDRVDIDCSITFVKDRVKDSGSESVNEGQEELFQGEKEPEPYTIDRDKRPDPPTDLYTDEDAVREIEEEITRDIEKEQGEEAMRDESGPPTPSLVPGELYCSACIGDTYVESRPAGVGLCRGCGARAVQLRRVE